MTQTTIPTTARPPITPPTIAPTGGDEDEEDSVAVGIVRDDVDDDGEVDSVIDLKDSEEEV